MIASRRRSPANRKRDQAVRKERERNGSGFFDFNEWNGEGEKQKNGGVNL